MDKPLPTSITCYSDAVDWIYNRIDYERTRPLRTSTHFRLERVHRLLSVIGSPQERIPAVHIAGTKGKGTTAAILSSILATSGVQTGLFTSPHLHVFEERMRVNGIMPNEQQLTNLVAELHDRLAHADIDMVEDGPTYFEVATLLCWMFFDQQKAEIAVLETGLGGRLDCTNVCRPLVTIITSIGLDHTQILGDTVELIAGEKAGILKSGVPMLTWAKQPTVIDVIRRKAEELQCPVYQHNQQLFAEILPDRGDGRLHIRTSNPWGQHHGLQLPLLGRHQAGNAALAVAAADYLAQNDSRMTPESIARGVAATSWPLRFEIFHQQPTIILDAAHNPDSIAAFVETVNEHFSRPDAVLIFASSKDKDAAAMLAALMPFFHQIVLTSFLTNPRATLPDHLRETCEQLMHNQADCQQTTLHITDTPTQALNLARQLSGTGGLICGTGSVFLAAELRQLVTGDTSGTPN